MAIVFDLLFKFLTEDAAKAALPGFGEVGEDGAWRWHPGFVFRPQCYLEGTYGPIDPETGIAPVLVPETILPGYYLWVGLKGRDPALEAMPECLLVADRAAGVIVHHKLTLQQLTQTRIRPVIAGSNYPFGSPVVVA